MRRLLTKLLLGLAGVALALYVALCGYLFAEQRYLIYQPSPIVLDGPPAGSGYALLPVPVPGLGVIKVWWAPPASRALPTVVFFHGNASSRRDFMALGQQLHVHGWGVVLASYRGYSGNPGSPTEDGLLADARATIAAVRPRVGPIIVWGHSLGSGVAARMTAEGRAAGLVLESPYTALPDVGALQYPYVPVRILMLDRFDTRSLEDRIKVPVLIFHGTDDPIIPFAMGAMLAHDLRATFVPMSDVGHYPHRRDLSPTVVEWARCVIHSCPKV